MATYLVVSKVGQDRKLLKYRDGAVGDQEREADRRAFLLAGWSVSADPAPELVEQLVAAGKVI